MVFRISEFLFIERFRKREIFTRVTARDWLPGSFLISGLAAIPLSKKSF